MTYAIKPVPIDDNGHALFNRASDFITIRMPTGSLTEPRAVSLPTDVKEFFFHIEGSQLELAFAGDRPGQTVPLIGAAVDNEDGTVTLPMPDGVVPAPGTEIIVAGTAHYDGTYTVAGISEDDDVIVPAVYVAETFSASASAMGCVYGHLTSDGWTSPVFRVTKRPGEVLCHLQPTEGAISLFAFR